MTILQSLFKEIKHSLADKYLETNVEINRIEAISFPRAIRNIK